MSSNISIKNAYAGGAFEICPDPDTFPHPLVQTPSSAIDTTNEDAGHKNEPTASKTEIGDVFKDNPFLHLIKKGRKEYAETKSEVEENPIKEAEKLAGKLHPSNPRPPSSQPPHKVTILKRKSQELSKPAQAEEPNEISVLDKSLQTNPVQSAQNEAEPPKFKLLTRPKNQQPVEKAPIFPRQNKPNSPLESLTDVFLRILKQ